MINLSQSLSNSLSEEIKSLSSSYLEMGIDSIMKAGLLKEVPIVSTVISAYDICHSVRGLHYIKKLEAFIYELNNCAASEEKRSYYKSRIKNNKSSNQEIEYLLLLIDRYVHCEKAQMLAKVYMSYLDDIITWLDCAKYAEIIDRFLPGDCEMLLSASTYKTEYDIDTDSIQRLIALGLVIEGFRTMAVQDDDGAVYIDPPELREKSERNYMRTAFGDGLVKILTEDCAR